jgi:hypothetical protein
MCLNRRMPLRSTGITLLHHYYEHVRLPDKRFYLLAFSACWQILHNGRPVRVSQVPTLSIQYHATAWDPGRVTMFSPLATIVMLPSSAYKLSASSNTRISGLIHSLSLRPGISRQLAPSNSLPP